MELKELSARVDQYAKAREKRLIAQRKVDVLQIAENELKAEIINVMRADKVHVVGGQHSIGTYTKVDKPSAGDWTKIYSFVKEYDAFDLLQKRLNESAVEARWEDKIVIPGITKFPVEKLSLSKVKR